MFDRLLTLNDFPVPALSRRWRIATAPIVVPTMLVLLPLVYTIWAVHMIIVSFRPVHVRHTRKGDLADWSASMAATAMQAV